MREAMVCILVLLVAIGAEAKEDPVANARDLAVAGQRVTALRILQMQLRQNPGDHDARTLYGTVLSWEGRFDEARQELRSVLNDDTRNLDARLALVRVELWSGRRGDAERLASESLSLFPNNADLLTLRNQALSRDEQSLVSIGTTYDSYEDVDDWRETFVEFKKGLRFGAVVARAARARRFGFDDDQFEIQFYPRIGRGGWASLSLAYAPDAVLYPETRLSAELYHALGKGFEASVGVSRLDFAEAGATNVYTGSLGKYIGNWLLGGRVYTARGDSASQGFLRRFFGEHGQYAELRVGKGTTRDEIRSATDIEALDVREIAIETLLAPGKHWMLRLRAGAGQTSDRDDRFSLSATVGRRF
ncbi:MAG: YaiO family outer membrane beta-barrel protein [Thermoanaerobaculia bacterium]